MTILFIALAFPFKIFGGLRWREQDRFPFRAFNDSCCQGQQGPSFRGVQQGWVVAE